MTADQIELNLQATLEKLRADQLAEGIPSAEVRRARIQQAIDLLVDNQDALAKALDDGAPLRGVETWLEELRAYAPGVARRVDVRGNGAGSPSVLLVRPGG